MSLDLTEAGSFAPPSLAPMQPQTVRIVSWNIARGVQFNAITEFLAAADADVILLQECDLNARRTASRNIARELAQNLRMNYAFGIEFQELAQGSRESPAFHGQATLSRWPLSSARIIRFRQQSKFWQPRWWIPQIPAFQRRIGGRIALVNRLSVGEKNLIAYNLHLESRNSDVLRHAQMTELLDDTRQYLSSFQIVVAGDFNCDVTANSASNLLRAAEFESPFTELGLSTVSNSSDRRAIDWILIRCGTQAQCARVHNTVRGSDHYPLSLTVPLL